MSPNHEEDGLGWFPTPTGCRSEYEQFLVLLRMGLREPELPTSPMNSGAFLVRGILATHLDISRDGAVGRCIECDYDGRQLYVAAHNARMGVEPLAEAGIPGRAGTPAELAVSAADWHRTELLRAAR